MNRSSALDPFPAPSGKSGWPWTSDNITPTDNSAPWPKISIITPSYNQGPFLEETIRSVLGQEYPNLEYIVMDGGSKDESRSILEKYDEAITAWVSEPDGGQSDALNKGFAGCTGDILAWLCADDRYFPGALRAVGDAFRRNPGYQLLYGDGGKIDSESRLLFQFQSDSVDVANLCNWCCFFTPGTFWRRSLWEKAGSHVDPENHFTMDWELMLRLSRHTQPVKIDAYVTEIRVHPGSKTIQGTAAGSEAGLKRDREVLRVSRQYGGWFCFNSVAFPFLQLARLRRFLPSRPGWFHRIGFAILHLPLRLVHILYGRPKSNLMD